jgi:hypothetical protein
LLGTHFPVCSEDKQPNYNQVAPHFCWVILDTKTLTYILGVKDGQTKRIFSPQVLAFSWCGKKGKNLIKINVRNSGLVSIGCLIFLHISSSIMLAYLPLSWGWCFFWGKFLPFLDKEIGNYYFSSVNLTTLANFLLNFTNFPYLKLEKKKHRLGV